MKILTVPAEMEILRRKSRPILKFDKELAEFLRELGETLKGQKDPAGVGLSAIQVGGAVRVFAMYLPKVNKGPALPRQGRALSKTKPELTFYINPEIMEHAKEMTLGEELNQRTKDEGRRTKEDDRVQHPASSIQHPFLEGCLSIPRIYGAVLRYPWIKAKAMVLTEPSLSQQSTINNQQSTILLNGLPSRVFQHELDHLNGILFTDHVLAQGNQLFRETGREMVEMEM